MANLIREIRFALTESIVRWTLLLAFMLSGFSLANGLYEVRQQESQLATLKSEAQKDQAYVLPQQGDAGGAAYYMLHLTYDPPSELAFAALGLRDELPWKHRVKMLALEGQIYEADQSNPELAYLGKLDFNYLVSILLPLLIIGLLYDLDARERRESRYELLCASSRRGKGVLFDRAFARVVLLFLVIIVPFLIALLISGAKFYSGFLVLAPVLLHALFWLVICRVVTSRKIEGITAAAILFGTWLVVTSLVPVVGKSAVERWVEVPNGGEILLTQRETVNDAWDLPKQATMSRFLEVHPEWRDYAGIEGSFEWKWYYAFQQVGDQQVEPMSTALSQRIAGRDARMGWVSALSPPLMVDRWLTKSAETDITQHMRYIACVRDFHAELRRFHYPMLFGREVYSVEAMDELPQFSPCVVQN
ncbi:DUF3526 domain-containing protein [Exilibacterium tricleocarpae]|uniref:DUF3526 domain-containing protein n=1 Tax=Exilibacterium tricleocarpae TaxID=2591008 RepID=A0A545T074_9GAMM|nr:DUF3526 domain-containing protein [Exilibacterium tricleocarpae]TQV70579.1 DUF3526 domain-containing protein [Exilibacterium tricleocarpae]